MCVIDVQPPFHKIWNIERLSVDTTPSRKMLTTGREKGRKDTAQQFQGLDMDVNEHTCRAASVRLFSFKLKQTQVNSRVQTRAMFHTRIIIFQTVSDPIRCVGHDRSFTPLEMWEALLAVVLLRSCIIQVAWGICVYICSTMYSRLTAFKPSSLWKPIFRYDNRKYHIIYHGNRGNPSLLPFLGSFVTGFLYLILIGKITSSLKKLSKAQSSFSERDTHTVRRLGRQSVVGGLRVAENHRVL